MAEPRTFKVQSPHMEGEDVADWQATLNRQMRTWHVDYRISPDGDYGVVTRDLTATALYGLGIERERMAEGVTPDLRIKVRNKRLTEAERKRYDEREDWRERLRERHEDRAEVGPPLPRVIADSWGWTPPIHDGIDLICGPRAPLLAICKAKVIRADSSGWWGKGAPSPSVAAKGDGIIVIRSLTDAGPFRKGLNFGYGHAEHPRVNVGETVEAGEVIGRAGFANAWHIHLVVNGRSDAKGVGDRDPEPFYRYAMSRR